ncbi:MAG: hypothetical protein OWR62_12835 [Sulfobacillus thermotolerans]|nr:hypothetical protein [Sulfobacillus thermotolerans]
MKRPISVFLLLMFAVLQIYVAKVPASHQVQTSSWMMVSAQPGGLVEQNGQFYLVTPELAMTIHATGIHITTDSPMPLAWEDVPEPSGAGVWRVGVSAGHALLGIGGKLYPAPNGTSALWIDGGSQQLYFTQPVVSAMHMAARGLQTSHQVVWASDAESAAILGQAAQGSGIYVWTRDHHLSPAIIPESPHDIINFGVTRDQSVIAALSNGTVLWQGHGLVKLPRLSELRVSRHHATALGQSGQQVVLWHRGQVFHYPLPAQVKWVGVPRFSPKGDMAATLGQSHQGVWHLLLYGPHRALNIRMPFSSVSDYHLLGFVGEHWVLVTVPQGPHHGTYAWWINDAS